MRQGIDLLTTDDSVEPLVPVTESTLASATIPPVTRRAIIVEKSQGVADDIVALRYDLAPASVARVWREFIASTVDVRRLGDENPEVFKAKIRKKAVNAIQNGLECDRDPYRQGSLGVQVMKGIGEFKSDEGAGVKVNILVGSVPGDWKQRYIGTGSGSGSESEVSRDDNKQ